MRILFVLGQLSAEIARVGWANMWCGEMRISFAPSNRVCGTCGGMRICFGTGNRAGRTLKHVAKCNFGEARRRPFARNERVNR